HVHLQGVIAAIAFRIPEKPARQIRIGTRTHDGNVFGALRDRTGGLANATGGAAARAITDLRWNAIGIDVKELMIAKGAYITNTKHRAPVELLLNREVPFLDCRDSCICLSSLRSIDCAACGDSRAA